MVSGLCPLGWFHKLEIIPGSGIRVFLAAVAGRSKKKPAPTLRGQASSLMHRLLHKHRYTFFAKHSFAKVRGFPKGAVLHAMVEGFVAQDLIQFLR